jgi:hypothetical protein
MSTDCVTALKLQLFTVTTLCPFREFPIGNTAITVGLMVRPKPGTMLLFRFEVPRQKKSR